MSNKVCPSCGAQAFETYYLCRACGDDYTGGAMAKVLDAHTASLRAEVELLHQVVEAARVFLAYLDAEELVTTHFPDDALRIGTLRAALATLEKKK